MNTRIILVLVCLFALLLPATTPIAAAPRCFPEAAGVASCVDGRIGEFWTQQGGLPVFGYPIGPQRDEGGFQTQVFERARLELHPENPPPYDVLLGRLGADRLRQQGRDPASFPQGQQDAGCLRFEQTGRSVCPPFLATWQRYGLELGDPGVSERESLALWGLPLSDRQSEALAPGLNLSVQWFERARFEDHGEQGVLLGLLGREMGGVTTQPPAPSNQLPPGGFIAAAGDQLTRLGQPVLIKGVNYYPQGRPWAAMWEDWKGPQVEAELRAARDDLGINAVRVLVPYSEGSWKAGDAEVDRIMLGRLREMIQIAGNLDLRVIVALFDFENNFPTTGSKTDQEQRAWVRQLVGNFVGDDRIMAWDLHNEPDNYDRWKEPGGPDEIQLWLGRLADLIHEIAPNHLVTVGVGHYETLFRPAPDGRRIIDYSDVISFHTYNAADTARQIAEIRARSPKPILLEEFGWPSGPACSQQSYEEATQEATYRQSIEAATGRVAGILQWTLRDYDPGPSIRFDTREEHYGLYRIDGSLKPAAEPFRQYAVPPLPAAFRTSIPLSATGPNPIDGPQAPKLIAETNVYVKQQFRRAWDRLGGQGSLGVPLSEAFVRPEDLRVVQYFSAAVLEYYPENARLPGFDSFGEEGQTKVLIKPVAIGEALTAGRGEPAFARIDDPGGAGVRYFPATGHSLRGDFRSFYNGTHGPWRLGLPISEEFVEQINGGATLVQYFQYGRLERSSADSPISFGALGRATWEQRCRSVGQ